MDLISCESPIFLTVAYDAIIETDFNMTHTRRKDILVLKLFIILLVHLKHWW